MTRRRSLQKDVNDWKQFRYGRDRHMGFSVSNEFYQPVPFFFTREGATLNMIGHYRGGSIFIIANGPSLVSGAYDLSLLKRPGVMTYGMNNGARTIRPNFWTCVDDPKRFMKSVWLDPCITKFIPHAHAEKKIFDNEKWEDSQILVGQCPNVVYYHRNEKFMAERFLFEDTVNWGNSGDNGGGRSVFLPVIRICFLLGFRNIYLMGADFKMSSNYTYHFDEQRAKGAVNCNNNTYDRLKEEYLPALKPYLEAEGCNVYNCNPESELKVFDYVPFDEAIKNATNGMGDVDNERTWGMYSKPTERQKWKEEPAANQKGHLINIQGRPAAPIYEVPNIVIPSVKSVEDSLLVGTPPYELEDAPTVVTSLGTPMAQLSGNPIATPMQEIPAVLSPIAKPPTPVSQPSQGSRRIIRPLPCGLVSDGSSANPSNNVTISDDGN